MPVNEFSGSDENDALNGTDQRDLIHALDGDDWVVLSGGRDTVQGGDGDDTVFGYFGGDQIFGGDGNDQLVSSTGPDDRPSLLDGGAGDDVIFVGDVVAQAFGGSGNDRVTVYFDQGGTAQGGAGVDHLTLTIGPLGDSLPAVADSTVILTGPGAGVTSGAYTLDISGFESLTLTTSYGNDTVVAGDLEDVIDVGAGANDVQALGGDDVVTYRTGDANALDGGEGTDTLRVLHNPQTTDLRFYANDSDDGYGSTFTGFERFQVVGGSGHDLAVLGAGRDTFQGFDGRDTVEGLGGFDRLDGNAGRDSLDGGAGRDILQGGSGVDTLTGGADDDTFLFRYLTDLGDEITDFQSGVDVIRLEAFMFGTTLPRGPLDPDQFALDTATSTEGQFVFLMAGEVAHRDLYWDADGTGAGEAVLIARLDPTATLTAADILLT